MLTIRSQTADLRRNWSRRDVMRLSIGSGLASWAPWARFARAVEAPAGAPPSFGKAKACIFIYLYGGPSHIDIWDLKPEAKAEIRGEFQPISTVVPGIQITEHLPKLAERAKQLAIVRSLTHDSPQHGAAGHQMLTGYRASAQGEIPRTANDAPHLGSILKHQAPLPYKAPPFVALPWEITTQINMIPGQGAGYLGKAFDPVRVQYDDQQGEKFLLPEPSELSAAVMLDRETDATRDRYGRNIFGQSLLMARRLVEAGVRVVTVYWPDRKDEIALNYNGKRQPVSVPMWDTHGKSVGDTANFPSLKNRLLPPLDLASSALLDDLAATGRLDETLIVWTGEFGRTPQIRGDGRGHHAKCFASMLAGGGIRGGMVYGQSDAIGAAPSHDPVAPGDLFATMYHLLGVPAEAVLPPRAGQPHKASSGSVISGLIA